MRKFIEVFKNNKLHNLVYIQSFSYYHIIPNTNMSQQKLSVLTMRSWLIA